MITAVNGTPVKDSRDLARKIGMMAPDTSAELSLLRNSESIASARTQGRSAILMRVKTAKATTFVALPIGNA